jgi:hypothetical protein
MGTRSVDEYELRVAVAVLMDTMPFCVTKLPATGFRGWQIDNSIGYHN